MWAVYKKELKSYLLTSVGYVFIGLFLFMFSIFFYLELFSSSVINFEYLFYNGATILTFITPVLTMRMFSEERKNGTEQLLLTSPRSITSIVLGKFFAAGTIMVITELFTLVYFAILSFFGTPSITVAIATLAGFLLLALSYLSFGMFASSITENQIIASVISIGAFLLMWFIPYFNDTLAIFSLINMFDKFPQGIVAWTEIIAFISFSALFIILTIISLQRRKSVK